MAEHRIQHVSVRGIASAVPQYAQTNDVWVAQWGAEQVAKICQQTGVSIRRISRQICSSDLCYAASTQLLHALGWDTSTVDALLFVTQTPDFRLPSTACSLQARLGLASHCAALDINLGCSGYVYGLWVAARLLSEHGVKRLLLLTGDTPSRFVSAQDRSTALLFGDAGSATALEYDKEAGPMWFQLGTDGQGISHLQIPAGGYRHPSSEQTKARQKQENGNVRSQEDLWMDGAEVFAFTLREIPALLQHTMRCAQWTVDDVDAFVPHQANRFLLRHLARRARLSDKMLLNLDRFGNTSVASIPLVMTTELSESLATSSLRLLLAGFGVGWSWGAVACQMGPLVMPPLLELVEPDPDCGEPG